ncbi:MAG: MarR family transcriptional regulator [Anaerolineae bacterium]|jgi:DNA-binding MarR family transcriptional regulator|nr:MarR family transcriptional regulator [Anaerolineae bacterium]
MTDQNRSIHHNIEEKHAVYRQHLMDMAGDEDIRGMEINGAIRMLANHYESVISQHDEFAELSSSRLGILLRLLGEKQCGNSEGINPTQISKLRNVSKNTVSALLRGLEDQGLIERTLDPSDRRRFLIRITPAGEALIRTTTPDRAQFMNQLAANLSEEEKDQLLYLLIKLHQSLLSCVSTGNIDSENDAAVSSHRNLSLKE